MCTMYNPLLRLYKYCVGIIKPFLLPSAPPFADICKTLHVVCRCIDNLQPTVLKCY